MQNSGPRTLDLPILFWGMDPRLSLCPPHQDESPPQKWAESLHCLHLDSSTHSKSGPQGKSYLGWTKVPLDRPGHLDTIYSSLPWELPVLFRHKVVVPCPLSPERLLSRELLIGHLSKCHPIKLVVQHCHLVVLSPP